MSGINQKSFGGGHKNFKPAVVLICIECNETVRVSLSKIEKLESYVDHGDSCSIGAYCPVCDEHTLHSTLL